MQLVHDPSPTTPSSLVSTKLQTKASRVYRFGYRRPASCYITAHGGYYGGRRYNPELPTNMKPWDWSRHSYPWRFDERGRSDSAMLEFSLHPIDLPRPSSFCVTHPEAMDPVSHFVFQYSASLSKSAQLWSLLHYFSAHPQSMLSDADTCTVVGRTYRKGFLPTSMLSPLALNFLTRTVADIQSWYRHTTNQYGFQLLMLLLIGYWIQGFRCFPWLAVAYHLKDSLQVDPATLQFLQSTVNVPMVAKPIYGIISDAVYIKGARRLPYLMIAGVLQLSAWTIITLSPSLQSSVFPLIGVLIMSNMGAAIAEVVNDAMVAECVKKERGRIKGQLQSFVWLALAAGGIMGNLLGGFALSSLSAKKMFAIFLVLIGLHLFVSASMKENSFGFEKVVYHAHKKTSIIKILQNQAMKLVRLVGKREIRRPLLWFSASYALIPTLAGSLFFYQTQCLNISPTYLGLAKVMGQMGLLIGSILYNRYFRSSSPRRVLLVVQLLLSFCMLSDIVLVSRLNVQVGIPDQIFVLGASAFVEAIAQFKVLPFTVLLTQLCPSGSEGSLLAFFMACHCFASILSGYLGTMLASCLQLSADSFVGLPFGILIQSMAALVPLLWITCIPSTAHKPVRLAGATINERKQGKTMVANA